MAKKDIEQEIRDLQSKLDNLKSEISDNSNTELLPIIKQLEDNASTLKVELYRKITPGEKIQLARHSSRPTTLDYINYLIIDFVQLHGDRRFADDLAMVGGVGMFEGIPVTVIGTQKGKDTKDNIKRHFGMPHPEGYRKALRLMEQAEKFGRPIINFIDTAGAYPGLGAEERGQGEAIAYNLYRMSTLKTPVISIITGEGSSGGALAIAGADSVYMLENAVYSILSPEGFASILWKDAKRAPQACDIMKIAAPELLEFGLIDGIIPEGKGCFMALKKMLSAEINRLMKLSDSALLAERYKKYRNIEGEYAPVNAK
jgi:acetyl-CoA carboxylase carboxyl transferase subunit alpha